MRKVFTSEQEQLVDVTGNQGSRVAGSRALPCVIQKVQYDMCSRVCRCRNKLVDGVLLGVGLLYGLRH